MASFLRFPAAGGGTGAPIITGPIIITGANIVGQTLTASGYTVTGSPTPTETLQWFRNGIAISGATSASYTLVAADAGQNVNFRVTATQGATQTQLVSPTRSIHLSIGDVYPTDRAHAWMPFIALGSWYGQPLVRLQLAGGSQQDFGADTNGYLDLSAIQTWAGSNDAFVHTVYDQFGGEHFTQTSNGNQWRIYVGATGTFEGANGIVGFFNLANSGGGFMQPASNSLTPFNFLHDGTFAAYTIFAIENSLTVANARMLYTTTGTGAGLRLQWASGPGLSYLINNASGAVSNGTGILDTGTNTTSVIAIANYLNLVAARRTRGKVNESFLPTNGSSGVVTTANSAETLKWGSTQNGATFQNIRQGLVIYKNGVNNTEKEAILKTLFKVQNY